MSDRLDEVYERLHATGPEFDGWLSNHGPMAADAVIRLGRPDAVDRWLAQYATRLHEPPAARWPIGEDQWREPLGDASRLGDWIAFFSHAVQEGSWSDLLTRWWPRLLPGAIASATHPLIRTGHVVRALGERDTPQRRAELASALGYWAARWQPLAGQQPPAGRLGSADALRSVPVLGAAGGIRTRLAQLTEATDWPPAQARLRPLTNSADVPAALDALVDAAVDHYADISHGSPVMLVHAATAPRAARLTLAALPRDLWLPTYTTVWTVAAAITAIYTPADASPVEPPQIDTVEDAADRATAHGDEHVIKFTEVAIESHTRGNLRALPAVGQALRLIPVV